MKPICFLLAASAALFFLLAGCSSEKPAPKPAAEAKPEAAPVQTVRVKFETSKGDFIVEVHPEWAPIGAKRFLDLVKDGYYTNARFFRVLPNYIAQFGLAAQPAMTRKWNRRIEDDPVVRTNAYGTLTFATAGPNARTAQLFINIRSNQVLDSQGFAPFAKVVEGMSVTEKFYSGYGEAPDQELITRRGNAYLSSQFPRLDFIKQATVL